MKSGNFEFNETTKEVTIDGVPLVLTKKEHELLLCLLENPNETVKRTDVLQKVWGEDTYFNSRSMDVYITKLRKKLSKCPIHILNVHGKGHKFLIDVTE